MANASPRWAVATAAARATSPIGERADPVRHRDAVHGRDPWRSRRPPRRAPPRRSGAPRRPAGRPRGRRRGRGPRRRRRPPRRRRGGPPRPRARPPTAAELVRRRPNDHGRPPGSSGSGDERHLAAGSAVGAGFDDGEPVRPGQPAQHRRAGVLQADRRSRTRRSVPAPGGCSRPGPDRVAERDLAGAVSARVRSGRRAAGRPARPGRRSPTAGCRAGRPRTRAAARAAAPRPAASGSRAGPRPCWRCSCAPSSASAGCRWSTGPCMVPPVVQTRSACSERPDRSARRARPGCRPPARAGRARARPWRPAGAARPAAAARARRGPGRRPGARR